MTDRVEVTADDDVVDGFVLLHTLFGVAHHFGELAHPANNTRKNLKKEMSYNDLLSSESTSKCTEYTSRLPTLLLGCFIIAPGSICLPLRGSYSYR